MIERHLSLLWLLALPAVAQLLEPPDLPAAASSLDVNSIAGARLKYHFLAVGKQIYHCQNGAWDSASTPDALLTETHSNMTVHHQAGPSWTTFDGRSTIRAIGKSAVHFPAPDGVSIDWLKLDVERASRTGDFSDIAIIQRLFTGAGKPRHGGCSANQVYESPYTAQYYFWILPAHQGI